MKHKGKHPLHTSARHGTRDDQMLKQMIARLGSDNQNVTFTRLKKAAGLQGAAGRQLISRAVARGFLSRADGRFSVTPAGRRLVQTDDRSVRKSAAPLVEAKILRLKSTYAFARPSDDSRQDIFIPGSKLGGALPGDTVQLSIRASDEDGQLPEGAVMEIVREGTALFSGTVVRSGKYPEVDLPGLGSDPVRLIGIADQKPSGQFYDPSVGNNGGLPLNSLKDLSAGERVTVRMIRNPGSFRLAGEVVQRFGSADLAANCAASMLAAEGVLPFFPEEVEREAEWKAAHLLAEEQLRQEQHRVDLREMTLFTIDGADAKDLDDAVSLSFDGELYHLGVHIADVSAYVAPGSAIDREAFRRGTSIYYANQVVPMLPRSLSNGACSLHPGVDRLAFSCSMLLDGEGRLVDYRFDKTVIRSRVRGVYAEVNRLLAGDADELIEQKYADVCEQLLMMDRLASLRAGIRAARGVPELETGEVALVIGEDGRCCGVRPRQRGRAEGMIEEFMLLAGESAARLGKKLGVPFVYRIHQKPDAKKLETLGAVMRAVGLDSSRITGDLPAAVLREVLETGKGSGFELLLNRQVLRTMMKAAYDDRPIGHYGLVLDDYAHFTSPIRRYPDLAIHRILSMALELSGGWPCTLDSAGRALMEKRWHKFAAQAAGHSSEAELRAMELERECEGCYLAEYMHGRLGDEFDGVITGVTAYGIYVETDEGVEGMIRLEQLGAGDYLFDGMIQLTDQLSGRRYRVGDRLRVRCIAADVSAGTIDFCPVSGGGEPPRA